MSSVLFLSRNAQLRIDVETVLTAAGHTVSTHDVATYSVTDKVFDCVVVDSWQFSHEVIAHLKGAGNTCIIGVYSTDREHLDQKRHGALWCIPDLVDVADELKDGPLSIESAIPVAQLTIHSVGLSPESVRMRAAMQDYLCSFKGPKGGARALFAAERARDAQ